MKKFIISCQILIFVFFVIKILFLTEMWQNNSISSVFSLEHAGQAIAQTNTSGTNTPVTNTSNPDTASTKPTTDPKDVTEDPLKKERDLFSSLQKRQKDLEIRENALKAEEEKVLALRKEIIEKIDTLKALETQLSSRLDMDKGNDAKRLQDLAKVYEAAPAQKAAAMLEQLDLKTAARITINMKRDKAGLIWGYLTPQKAVAITNELTRTARMSAE
jgi:flagellar motility protein MotE (MotC chaperone)